MTDKKSVLVTVDLPEFVVYLGEWGYRCVCLINLTERDFAQRMFTEKFDFVLAGNNLIKGSDRTVRDIMRSMFKMTPVIVLSDAEDLKLDCPTISKERLLVDSEILRDVMFLADKTWSSIHPSM